MLLGSQRRSSFDVAGPPDAPAIVFIHGAAWTRAAWLPQMEALADEFRVLALDLPGHGPRADEPFRISTAVRDVADMVAAAAQSRAILVGLSLGGYVAIAHAHAHPQQVAGLVLSGCSVDYRVLGILSWLDASLALKVYGERRLLHMQEKTVRGMLPLPLAEAQIAAGFTFRVMPAAYRELARHDFRALLQAYPGPTLVLNGERDTVNRRSEGRLLAAARMGRLDIIKDAGHGCNLEQPAAFTEVVRTFARSTNAATAPDADPSLFAG